MNRPAASEVGDMSKAKIFDPETGKRLGPRQAGEKGEDNG
jgi:hypothetical protein